MSYTGCDIVHRTVMPRARLIQHKSLTRKEGSDRTRCTLSRQDGRLSHVQSPVVIQKETAHTKAQSLLINIYIAIYLYIHTYASNIKCIKQLNRLLLCYLAGGRRRRKALWIGGFHSRSGAGSTGNGHCSFQGSAVRMCGFLILLGNTIASQKHKLCNSCKQGSSVPSESFLDRWQPIVTSIHTVHHQERG